MDTAEYWMVSIGILNLLVISAGLLFTAWQAFLARRAVQQSIKIHQSDHDWNRRIAAQEVLNAYNSSVVLSNLQKEFGYVDRTDSISVDNLENKFSENSSLRIELHVLLNYYESIARGVQQGIYDEEVIKAGRKGSLTRAYRAFQFYIERRRIENNSPKAWSELEALALKWAIEDSDHQLRGKTNVES